MKGDGKMVFSISEEVRSTCPDTALGLLHYKASVEQSSPELLQMFEDTLASLASTYQMDTIAQNPHIASTRGAYKALGKSPHEYRNAAEAMLRRVVKQSGLYHINNIVEINNCISVSSGYSIGSYDAACLKGSVELRRAPEGTHYPGIGKGSVNIGCLPVLYDAEGPFGNPTSDSRRAMIQEGSREIVSVLYGFDGPAGLTPWMERFAGMLQQYCGVADVDMQIIE